MRIFSSFCRRSRRRRPVVLGLAALALPLAGACSAPGMSVPDRVLLVTIDTLRADRLGCYGASRAHTPSLDALAAGGVRFDDAISPVPLTLPAHASLMTGLDPPGHGVRHNSIHRLDEGIPTLAEGMRSQGYATAAFIGALVLDRRFGLARGFDLYDDRMERRSGMVGGFAERPADRVVEAALEWLGTAPPRFFLWLHLYDPHAERVPPPGFAAAFASDPYAGEIAFVDHEIGRLLDGIRERFGEQGLLVAVTSDHGESLGEHGERTHSYTLYDATQRVPMILHGVGQPAGRLVEATVALADLAPTLLAAAGAPPLPGATGRDLAGLVGAEGEERAAYVETMATHLDHGWSPLVGLRTRRFKYIRAPRPELYDLVSDPSETVNLAAEEPELVRRMDESLEARLARSPRTAVTTSLEPEAVERLRSLGYVVPAIEATGVRPDLGTGPDPKDEIGLLTTISRAQRHASFGRYAEALALLRDIEQPSTHLSSLRSAMAFNAGEYDLSARDALRALAAEPRRVHTRIVYGSALEKQGDAAGARVAYREAVSLAPRALEAWWGIVRTSETLGDAQAMADAQARAEALADVSPKPR